jgi:hypothetical protein
MAATERQHTIMQKGFIELLLSKIARVGDPALGCVLSASGNSPSGESTKNSPYLLSLRWQMFGPGLSCPQNKRDPTYLKDYE